MTRRLVLFSCFLAFLIPACQDYNYEELRGSIVKEKRKKYYINVSAAADILFIIDNSGSMAGEQRQLAESFQEFASVLEQKFGEEYHIGVITTGMDSRGCPPCDSVFTSSCTNPTGENGRFQDRVCRNVGTDWNPEYVCEDRGECRVVNNDNQSICFYNQTDQAGTAFVGVKGCGFERGLAPMKLALKDLSTGYNSGFLRDDATLVVVVISDEEDCGEVGDVYELTSDGGNVCYFASKGEGPEGNTSHVQDPEQRPYFLTPVEHYYDFLMNEVKGGKKGAVKFAAIVGVADKDNPSTTKIEYEMGDRGRWEVVDACTTSGCTGDFCYAKPGLRYIELAEMFGLEKGQSGFLDTICQNNFSETMKKLGDFVACPRKLELTEIPLDPALAGILIDGEEVPHYTCSIEGRLEVCDPDGSSCPQGSECVRTWVYCDPDDPNPRAECQCDPDQLPECKPLDFSEAIGGVLVFAQHYDPCKLIERGVVEIEFVYVLP